MSPKSPQHASGDELDDILYGIAAEGGYDRPQTEPPNTRATNDTDAGLGIDEEIVVTKKRIPIPKLDDVRLRSEPGIPRLRRISKERLRFKGKGHEYGDIARMLNMYQLWLDELYPRAKFADALAIIEKVGHTKRMQVDRKAWIDEGKPGRQNTEHDVDDLDANVPDHAPAQGQQGTAEELGTGEGTARISPKPITPTASNHPTHPTAEEPDEDELDALLAETAQSETTITKAPPSRSAPTHEDPFADEMEAMEGMDDMW